MGMTCKIVSGAVGFGINKAAEQAGLPKLPLGSGQTVDLNPGYFVKRELRLACGDETGGSILALNPSTLNLVTQKFIMDRMKAYADDYQNRQLGLAGDPRETPSVAINFTIGTMKVEGGQFLFAPDPTEGVGVLGGGTDPQGAYFSVITPEQPPTD